MLLRVNWCLNVMLLIQEFLALHFLPPLLLNLHLHIVRHCVEKLSSAHQVLICYHVVEIFSVLFDFRIFKLILFLCSPNLDTEAHFSELVHWYLGLGLNLSLIWEESGVHSVVPIVDVVTHAGGLLSDLSDRVFLLAHSFYRWVWGTQGRVSAVVKVQLVMLDVVFHKRLTKACSSERPYSHVVCRHCT